MQASAALLTAVGSQVLVLLSWLRWPFAWERDWGRIRDARVRAFMLGSAVITYACLWACVALPETRDFAAACLIAYNAGMFVFIPVLQRGSKTAVRVLLWLMSLPPALLLAYTTTSAGSARALWPAAYAAAHVYAIDFLWFGFGY